ncbi:O-antigen ligase family protein [Peribacillus frigoritolerans]|uniref:O-antigen ligase family protein n=1 Tax=Peribacillus frigoritolerans TaxID=450367 RepID=UPI002E238F4F|nr:O-antigen ligase family protein [Peribacillus frigoritolerans]
MKKKLDANEFLFVTYIWMFTFLKPILQEYSNYSFFILIITTIIILSISIIKNGARIGIKYILFLVIVELNILIDILWRINDYSFSIQSNIIIFGLISVYLFSKIKDYNKVLYYYCFYSIVAFLLFFSDPFFNYKVFQDYLGFGYYIIVPSYIGFFILRKKFKLKYFIPLEIFCLIEALLFSNRGTTFCILFFLILYELLINRVNYKQFIKYIFIFIIISFIISNLSTIANNLYSYILKNGYSSYSLHRMIEFLNGQDTDDFLSGRDYLWENAVLMIKQNPLVGSGLGAFESIYGGYTHNFILDLLINFGLIGFLFILFLILKSIFNIFKCQNTSEKILMLSIFSICIPKLLLSSAYYSDFYFWIILYYSLKGIPKKFQIIDINNLSGKKNNDK